MAYTTKDAIRAATGFSDTDNISDTTIEAYIADADSVINAKIADVYSVPLSETPDIIEMLSRHITIGLLYANEYGEESEDTDKGWKGRMDWAMSILDDIQDQKTKLRDSSGNELARTSFKKPAYKPTTASSAVTAEDTDAPYLTMNEQY